MPPSNPTAIPLPLKEYQKRTLHALRDFFRLCVQYGKPSLAFTALTEEAFGTGLPYHKIEALPSLPYVCLRLPTGGGKTLVAAHAVSVTAQEFLHSDNALVLWLTPSNAIRAQTLNALRRPGHPYHRALADAFSSLTVLDVGEALNVQPATLSARATVIVATMQAFRVDDTEGRKVYEPSGALMAHFSGVPAEALLELETYDDGTPKTSLANVLRLRRPIVIVDEAHNFRTPLSVDTLARFGPACILEFTATPDVQRNPSNVLHSVSAAELKAEGMIKLPIELTVNADWREVVTNAVAQRNQLEEAARLERAATGEYLRPIVLLQAQPRYRDRESLTVDVLKTHLLSDQGIHENQIAIATGDENQIEGVDLSDPVCPIRYIITVQALREGWDCPFAYVLCSVAEQHSPTAVEQILGRILRLPMAAVKQQAQLNKAYAFSASSNFGMAADALKDALVHNGFEKQEADQLVARREPSQSDFGPLFNPPPAPSSDVGTSAPAPAIIPLPITQPPSLADLAPEIVAKVAYDPISGSLALKETLNQAEAAAVAACFIDPVAQQAITQAAGQPAPSTSAGRPVLSVPILAVHTQYHFEAFDETHFLEHGWNLAQRDPFLTAAEYSNAPLPGESGTIDLTAGGKVSVSFVHQLQEQMSFLSPDQGWTLEGLAGWLDRSIPHIDIPAQQSGVFFRAMIERLIADRSIPLAELVRDRYRLKKAAAAKVDAYRAEARKAAFQQFLIPEAASPLIVRPEICFTYDPEPMNYPAPAGSLYPGQHHFHKHYYPVVGRMDSHEEQQCAAFIDRLPQVQTWVRNLSGRPRHSFWLQTATDRFYPDFICRLANGRYLAVEYKGADRWSTDDAKEKRMIGQFWESRSSGECLFIMPNGPEFETIRAKVAG